MTYTQRSAVPLFKRLFSKFLIGDGCWEWIAAKDPQGYGRVNRGRKGEGTVLAHRAVYVLLVGPIPATLQLDHLCRDHACVRPSHLEPVTARENTVRGVGLASRVHWTHCNRGHEFNEANTYRSKNGTRGCRRCHADRERVRQKAVI